MEYPKYKREEKLSAKLSRDDVLECRRLRFSGYTLAKIANIYKMNASSMYYVCLSDEEQLKYNKKKYQTQKPIDHKDTNKRVVARKKEFFGDRYIEFTRHYSRLQGQKHKIRKTKYNKEWVNNNREKYNKYHLGWYYKNLEQYRNRRKKYYQEHAEEERKKQREFYKENKDYYINYNKEHKEKINAYQLQYRKLHQKLT